MEKRLIFAFVLSFSIIYIWSIYFSPKTAATPQILQNKELTSQSVAPKIEAATVVEPAAPLLLKEKTHILENDNISLVFSNIGAKLKSAHLTKYNYTLPVKNVVGLEGYDTFEFEISEATDDYIVYRFENKELIVTKKYQFIKPYLAEASITLLNKENKKRILNYDANAFSLEISKLDISSIDKNYYEYVLYANQNYIRKSHAYNFTDKESKNVIGPVDWVAFRDRYFCLIVKPLYKPNDYSITTKSPTSLNISLNSKGIELEGQGEATFNYSIFVGPENTSLLNDYDKDFPKIKMFYRFGLFDLVAKFLYNSLHFIHKIIHSWGVSIILICLVIYLAMYPLTLSSMSSMKRMQQLQPKINELKDKYKNNQQKQSLELMQLYKDNKINPMGGCLPLLLQMPFFIGIYQVLWRDVSFKGAEFLWIKDLTLPDRLIILPFNIPFMGNEFNILPILYAIAMFFQQKLSAKTMVSADPTQAEVQKMMTMMMPVMLAVLFYKFPSGITLYFTVYFLLNAFTQWKLSKT
jgi:YidC/Oxa1 family membrane protein insertase